MSNRRLPNTYAGNQRPITSFVYTPPLGDRHERTRQLIAEKKNQERAKQATLNSSDQEREKPFTPQLFSASSKRKTPPSVEKDDVEDISK